MPVKYVFFFRNNEQGWSESFYRSAFFDAGGQVILDNYIQRRLNLLSTNCSLISVRASDVNTARDVTIKEIPTAGMPGTWVYGSADPTAPNSVASAILLRLTDGAQHYRNFNMLGIPDHVISDNVVPPAEEAILRGRLNTWMGAINTASFTMKINALPALSGRILAYGVQDDVNQLVKLETADASGPWCVDSCEVIEARQRA